MKSNLMKFFGVAIVSIYILAAVSSVMAKDKAAPEAAPAATPAVESKVPAMPPPLELRKTGVISVTKDTSGKVTDIKLIVTSYTIILDENSKPLESMDSQKVRVTGTFSMQDGKRCFTVKSVELVASAVKASSAAKKASEKPAVVAPTK